MSSSQPKYKVNDRVRIRHVLKTSNRYVIINGKPVESQRRKGVIKEISKMLFLQRRKTNRKSN